MSAAGVTSYVNRNNHNGRGRSGTRDVPATIELSQNNRPTNRASMSKEERQRRANSARVPIPQTILKREDNDLNDLAVTIANRSPPGFPQRTLQQRGTFDDTDFDDTLSSDLSTVDGHQHFHRFTTDYNRPSYELLSAVDHPHFVQQYGQVEGYENKPPERMVLRGVYREEFDEGKILREKFSSSSSIPEGFDEDYHEDDIFAEHLGLDHQAHEANGAFSEQRRYTSRQQNDMPPPPLPTAPKATSGFSSVSIPTSKASSYVGLSDDDILEIPPRRKRARTELDYSPDDLKAMVYNDLHTQPFDIDPRVPHTTSPVDEHGIPLTLARKLANLPKMKDDDVRALFASQTDTDWAETGSWFTTQFAAHMKRLMSVRQERRIVSLTFETEIRRRQASVAAKTADVEQELRQLKAGSRELIGSRLSPSK